MASSSQQSFNKLKTQIEGIPYLIGNKAVKQALDEIDNAYATQPEAYFDNTTNLFDATQRMVKDYFNANSPIDIIAGTMDGLSSLITAVAGGNAVVKGLGGAVKLIGSLVGAFGTSKETKYMQQLTAMVSGAVSQGISEQLNQDICSDLELMASKHNTVAGLLAIVYTDPIAELKGKAPNNTDYFTLAGLDSIGKAISNLRTNMVKDKSSNWQNTAEIFYNISRLIAFKLLFSLEGIAYMHLAEGDTDSDASGCKILARDIDSFIKREANSFAPFFSKPTIVSASITHMVYGFEYAKFSLIAALYRLMTSGSVSFWPTNAKPYRFNCSIADKHDKPYDVPSQEVRLTTLYAHQNDNSVLVNPDTGFLMIGRPDVLQPEVNNTPIFIKPKDKFYKEERSHFSIWAQIPDGAPAIAPYYRWALQSKNKYKVEHDNGKIIGNQHTDEYLFCQLENFYIFEVFPTEEEIANNGKSVFPNNWKNKPDGKRSYLMMGNANPATKENKLWCDHNGKDIMKKESFYEIVYNSKHYGCPDHCLWYLMDEKEK